MSTSSRTILTLVILCAVITIGVGCNSHRTNNNHIVANLIDNNATLETKALYFNLKKLVNKGILIGQQDATAYGVSWKNEELRSDIYDVCGNFPSVYGWELEGVGSEYNIDSVKFDRIKFWIKSAYERGGIQTLSWHLHNPVSGKNAWDLTPAVTNILPGGDKNEYFNKQLDLVADFILDLKSKNGTLIPVIFRPFHENNGGWFWWGVKCCSAEDYKKLYQYTVTYLRDNKGVHNIIYAYSPDIFGTLENYMERFPGSDYVDVIGFDNYSNFKSKEEIPDAIAQIRIIVNMAHKMDKIAALTETGCNGIPDSTWWTDYLLNPIKNDSLARSLSWILIWRNSDNKHFFAPYPGHPSSKNFIRFENDPYTIFESDLPDMYKNENQ